MKGREITVLEQSRSVDGPDAFHAVTFFVHLRNNSQMPNKLMTTKKAIKIRSAKTCGYQEDKHNSYRKPFLQETPQKSSR